MKKLFMISSPCEDSHYPGTSTGIVFETRALATAYCIAKDGPFKEYASDDGDDNSDLHCFVETIIVFSSVKEALEKMAHGKDFEALCESLN